MNLNILTLALVLLAAASVNADAARSITLYLDGAQVEQRESAKKGYLEIYLPPDAQADSLRIAPVNGAEILRVVTATLKSAKTIEKELLQLVEREDLLHDRLKALTVREEIFKAAAKSQSAKAPRRTKSNPEPLSTIRQGTDYAITQLETVYQAKRRAEKELARIAERRAQLGKDEKSGGTVARVWITPATGSVTATWSQAGRSWAPFYQLRVDAQGSAVLSLMVQGITLAKGETAVLALSSLQSGGNPLKFRYESDWALVMKEKLNVTNVKELLLPVAPLKISFVNSSSQNLPPGDISCFKGGVYLGNGRFQGVTSGNPAEIVCSN